jgi:serpin B
MRLVPLLLLLACADDPPPAYIADVLPDTADTDPPDTDPPDTDPPDTDTLDTEPVDPLLPAWCQPPGAPGSGDPPSPRALTSPTADLAPALASVSQFTWRVFTELEDDNVVVSPISLVVALAMTAEGAAGATRDELDALLAIPADRGSWRDGLTALLDDVAGTSQLGDAQVRFANRLFGRDDVAWSAPFLTSMTDDWDAPLEYAPFATAPADARDQINAWVSDQTCAMIPALLPPDVIKPITALVLVNALFAEADWAVPFDPARTQPAPFHVAAGPPVTHPFMGGEMEVLHAHVDDHTVAGVPLAGGELGFWVAMPDDPAGLPAVEAGVVAGLLDTWIAEATRESVLLHFPKHDVREATELRAALTALGAPLMFLSGEADFTPMTDDDRPLFVDAVVHEATIQFFEEGLRAAAATAVVVGDDSDTPPPELWIDRPFVWVLRDELTGLILFVGRTASPAAG